MPKKVSLFIPCLVDQVYPEMGMAMVRILERLGYELDCPAGQTCCGQPAFNAGHREESLTVARNCLGAFADSETIVSPSGSCTAMLRNFFPVLFQDDAQHREAVAIGKRAFEFSEFLARENRVADIEGSNRGKIGFHNSCHSFRELHLENEPRALLERIRGHEIVEVGEPVCCGFGGLFSVKFESIASAMARTRLELYVDQGVDTLVSNDPGCIMHMRQEATDRGFGLEICHLAEYLDRAMGREH